MRAFVFLHPIFLTRNFGRYILLCMPRRFENPKPVRRKLVVRFDDDLRRNLDRIGDRLPLLYAETGRPRDAELVRLLLVCGLLGTHASVHARVALAVLVNAEIALSTALGEVAGRLRDAVLAASVAAATASAKASADPRLPWFLESLAPVRPPVGSRHERPREEAGVLLQQDRTRVHLVLDGWLFRAVAHFADGASVADQHPRSLGSEAVRQLLWSAVRDCREHWPAMAAYVKAINRMKADIAGATEAGRIAVARAIELSTS